MIRGTAAIVGFALAAAGAAVAQIADTRHNLSVSGPGPAIAASESDICIFCHTPHDASPVAPLWNRPNPGSAYTPYTSSTAVALPGQPTGASMLCLSCHDGTVALGSVLSRGQAIQMAPGFDTLPTDRPSYLGTDLSDDHPVSFIYDQSLANQHQGELADPSTLVGPVRLDQAGELQCTACHDAHRDDFGKFLVIANVRSALCRTCHLKSFWAQSSHSLSAAGWNGMPPDPWPSDDAGATVADQACGNCHSPHTAGGHERLLHFAIEEDNCAACHNGHVAATDIMAEVGKTSAHPVTEIMGVHDPSEPGVIGSRHAECADCHDPHAVNDVGVADLPGALTNVRGITISGTDVAPITREYELCLRCHGDSNGKPPAPTPRQIEQTNTRLEFQTGNPSFHPVAGPGVNPDVPSLILPLNTGSVIACGDCHANDNAQGPAGPHGSIYTPLLERRYETADNTPESASNYALCYKCHDRNSILGDESFREHDKHVRGENTPCNVCHDAHGISSTQGNAVNNSKLINFDISVVSPRGNGDLFFRSTGRFAGECALVCHGADHNPFNYP